MDVYIQDYSTTQAPNCQSGKLLYTAYTCTNLLKLFKYFQINFTEMLIDHIIHFKEYYFHTHLALLEKADKHRF